MKQVWLVQQGKQCVLPRQLMNYGKHSLFFSQRWPKPRYLKRGKILGISRANVWCLQKKFRNRIEGRLPVKSNWGGRRNATMTLEEESDFLMPWVERAKQGGVLIVPLFILITNNVLDTKRQNRLYTGC